MLTNESNTQANCAAVTQKLPQRYEIWTASFPDEAAIHGCRPVIIVGTNEDCGQVTVVPLTSKLCYKQKKTHILIEGQGLLGTSRGLGEIVTTLPNCKVVCGGHRREDGRFAAHGRAQCPDRGKPDAGNKGDSA